MNVNGVSPAAVPGSIGSPRGVERAVPNPAPSVQQTGAETPAHTGSPPPGADPALWSVLTSEERAFFSRMAELGPVTYGPNDSGTSIAASPRGQRIDVRA